MATTSKLNQAFTQVASGTLRISRWTDTPGRRGPTTSSEVMVTRLGTAGSWDVESRVTVLELSMFDFVPLLLHTYTVPPITVTIPAGSPGFVQLIAGLRVWSSRSLFVACLHGPGAGGHGKVRTWK